MLKKTTPWCLLLGLALASVTWAAPAPVGWWRLDEPGGTVATDSSGNGNDGTINGAATYRTGLYSRGLYCDGSEGYLAIPGGLLTSSCTVAFWFKPDWDGTDASDYRLFDASNGDKYLFISKGSVHATMTAAYLGFFFEDSADTDFQNVRITAAGSITAKTWYHVAATWQFGGGVAIFYVDGKEVSRATGLGSLATLFANPRFGYATGGGGVAATHGAASVIDDIKIFDSVLDADEIVAAMQGAASEPASGPRPADRATDVLRDTALSWAPGVYAKSHDVYFGTSYDDVNSATRASAKGVLASQGQTATSFDPAGLLTFGQTYYWRVDEVNAAPDSTIYRGSTWSFTAEPYGYPVKPIKATASGSLAATMGPDKTMDGSGLDSLDQHGTSSTQMWISKKGTTSPWIQYELDGVYTLYQMWVWNSNQPVEQVTGFGAQTVTIETSKDGTTWAALANVPEFGQGTGEPNYVHNTTVDFGGVEAKFVKLTITSNWAGTNKQASLSEVRFFYVPVKAFGPTPANAATGVALDAVLNWRPGREAVKHQVVISADAKAVTDGTASVKTVSEHSLALDSLGIEYGKTYYWKVSEVNDAAATKVWDGDVWSFTTIAYGVVDDMESYNDGCGRIFFAWVDGFGHNGSTDCSVAPALGNNTGSTVGNTSAPFAEKTIFHSGKQSMPMAYDNTKSPFCSETQREWPTAQSWTGGGANTLTVWLRGEAAAFIETSPGTLVMNGTGTDIWDASDQFRFAYKTLKGNGSIVAKIEAVSNPHEWAKAGVMIRETTSSGSTHVLAAVTPTATHGVSFQRRTQADTATNLNTDVANTPVPQWVKVTRNGSTFTAQYSSDGVAWTDFAVTPAVTITMANDVLIGLAVTSHLAGSVCGAKFSNVSVTGTVSSQWQLAEVGAAQVAGNIPETFYVLVQDSAGKSKVVSNADPTLIATGSWQQWDIPLSQLTSVGVNVGAIKKLSIGVGDRSSPKAGNIGKLYIDDIRLTRVGQ